jgi:hypothetical protein
MDTKYPPPQSQLSLWVKQLLKTTLESYYESISITNIRLIFYIAKSFLALLSERVVSLSERNPPRATEERRGLS